MLEILTFAMWTSFVAYATWYFTSAKHYAPITPTEARMLWKIHKHNHQCNGKRWREIKIHGKTVGFECECGYKHIQQRLIIVSPPTTDAQTQNARPIVIDKLHTSYRSK